MPHSRCYSLAEQSADEAGLTGRAAGLQNNAHTATSQGSSCGGSERDGGGAAGGWEAPAGGGEWDVSGTPNDYTYTVSLQTARAPMGSAQSTSRRGRGMRGREQGWLAPPWWACHKLSVVKASLSICPVWQDQRAWRGAQPRLARGGAAPRAFREGHRSVSKVPRLGEPRAPRRRA